MENAELAQYITDQRALGVADDAIKQALLTSGWTAELVDATLASSLAPAEAVATVVPPQTASTQSVPALTLRPAATTPPALTLTPPATSSATITPATSSVTMPPATTQPLTVAPATTPTAVPSAEIAPLNQFAPTTTPPAGTPKSLKIAAILTWILALNLFGTALLMAIISFILAYAMQSKGLVVPALITKTALAQQPFMLAAIAVMLVWLGRGVWVGSKKLSVTALLVAIGAVVTWVATQWLLAADFAKLMGEQPPTAMKLLEAPTAPIQFFLSPIVLVGLATIFALVLSLPATDSEKKPPSTKAKIILAILSILILGPVIGLTTTVSAWSLDTDAGATKLAPQVSFKLHTLPKDSEFAMVAHWKLAEGKGYEPKLVAQMSVMPKADETASLSAQRAIVVRQYPPTDIALAKILQPDMDTQSAPTKQVELGNGTMGIASEQPFGQGKISALAFVSSDGVIIRMVGVRVLLPDLIKLANELN